MDLYKMARVLLLAQIPSALMVAYLDLLTVGAIFWKRRAPSVAPASQFAILIPAYNEETLLPRLLDSIAALDYPNALYDVHVVADNCTDRTVEIATNHGVIVHERHDLDSQGKGHALRWLLGRMRQPHVPYDAYVIIDADSVVSHNFLGAMNDYLARGDRAIQSYYGVWNRDQSWSAALHYARFAVFNGLRPRGRDALGLSAGLRGNGMCFRADLLESFGWESFALAEDVEFHFKLVQAGIRVSYAADAGVFGEMPASLRQAESQNVRWERGRLQMVRTFAPGLLVQGLRGRDPVQLDAVAEQLVPPLSVLTAITGLFFLITRFMRLPNPRRLASVVLLGQIAYIVTGLKLVRAERRIYVALIGAPLYIAWKLWIYVIAAARLGDNRWIRTDRNSSTGHT